MVLPLQVETLYGPVQSRRLGRSLGINCMPSAYKLCSFNCVYCHYGWTQEHTLNARAHAQDLPTLEHLVERITLATRSALEFDYLTFSGNGEPTLHPQFSELVPEVARIRDRYRPGVKLALLSNSTGVDLPGVRDSLRFIDLAILKLDVGSEEALRRINRPVQGIALAGIVESLASLQDICLQTLLLDGALSNVPALELDRYFALVARIQPREVQIYSTDRPVADQRLVRVPPRRLQEIARRGEVVAKVPFRAFWA